MNLTRSPCLGRTLWPGAIVARMKTMQFTAIIGREGDGYVALCPDLDLASQGASIDEARTNLAEAVQLFLECADESEVQQRLHGEI